MFDNKPIYLWYKTKISVKSWADNFRTTAGGGHLSAEITNHLNECLGKAERTFLHGGVPSLSLFDLFDISFNVHKENLSLFRSSPINCTICSTYLSSLVFTSTKPIRNINNSSGVERELVWSQTNQWFLNLLQYPIHRTSLLSFLQFHCLYSVPEYLAYRRGCHRDVK